MKIGIGICTYNRPDGLSVLLESIKKHCLSITENIYLYNDGSNKQFDYAYERVYKKHKFIKNVFINKKNMGVAYAKNKLLLKMLYEDCDWMFIIEDDIEIIDSNALNNYIKACINSGYQHLSFHSPAFGLNIEPISHDENITLWPHLAGGFCIFSRQSILRSGLLDETFYNAWEHIDHTQRIAQKGFTSPFINGNADATGSENLLRDQEIYSVIRSSENWIDSINNQNVLWLEKYPDTWNMVFNK